LIFATNIGGTSRGSAIKTRRDKAAALHGTIDTAIHRAIGLLEAGQIGEALACLRAMDAACEASHLRCNLAGLA
jgi:hypothetical protein